MANGKKYKKKDNFLRQTKRQGKKGNFGKGRRLSEDEYNYFMRVLEQLKHVDGEGKEILVRNFFRELQREDQERSLACNQIVSRILDDAIPLADVTEVIRLCKIFGTDLRPLCVDPFASHVLQTLLIQALKYSQKGAAQKRYEETEDEEEVKEISVPITKEQSAEFHSFLEKVGRFIFNNLEDFVCDTYASHVLRTVLEVCSGVDVDHSTKNHKGNHMAKTNTHSLKDEANTLTVPKVLKDLLVEFATRFKRLPNLPDVMASECGSAVLQSLVSILGHVDEDKCKEILTHLIEHGLTGVAAYYVNNDDDNDNLPPLFHDNSTIRLLEVMVNWCSSEQQSTIFKQYFEGKINILVKHRQANFAVQRLVAAWKDKEMFGDIYDEVSRCMGVAVEAKHAGILTALTQACRGLNAFQTQCIKAVMELLGCWEGEKNQAKFAMSLLQLHNHTLKEQDDKQDLQFSLLGSLALQHLIHFQKPIKIVSSILESRTVDLQAMACDPRGSHVIDEFILSSTVGGKSKEKLVYQFKGRYSSLACSKHGSRSLEVLWKVASSKAKTQICKELLNDEMKLLDNQFGKIIYNNFQVGLFKRGDKTDWMEVLDKKQKKRKMFDDLLTEEVSEKKKKKKKGSSTHDSSENDQTESETNIFIDTEGVE